MVLVVNMIPRSLSGETNQDSEPSLAVNPAEPRHIVGTAFTPDPMGGSNAPIYVSTDGGRTWLLNFIVPSTAGSPYGTTDITVAFGNATGVLYAGILKWVPTVPGVPNQSPMQILRAADFRNPALMEVLTSRTRVDQPFAHAGAMGHAFHTSRDLLLVGMNDLSAPDFRTATIDILSDAGVGFPTSTSIRLEARQTGSLQNGPQVRPTAHMDGTLYATFYSWRSKTPQSSIGNSQVTADVVVVRDDEWAQTPTPFQALRDPADGLPGIRVARNVQFPFQRRGTLGQQRVGGALSIVTDPRNSSILYLAWADMQPTGYTIHLRRSSDRGNTWSEEDLLNVAPHSTNPALALNSEGIIGLLYQQLTNWQGPSHSQRWVTHFARSADGEDWSDLVLADTPAISPIKKYDPYLGDYVHLLALDKEFYGIFSANNTPDYDNFPNGVAYQRHADFSSHTLLTGQSGNPVAPSIDPFFFRAEGLM